MGGRSWWRLDPGPGLARIAHTQVIVPLAALLGVALLLSAAALGIASRRQDALQLQAETRAIGFSLRQLSRALSAEVRDYAWWDEALQHLVLAPDATWADENVGPYVMTSFGYEVSLVIGGDGRVTYGHVGGRRDFAGAAAQLGPGLARLVAAAVAGAADGEPRPVDAVLAGPDGLHLVAASAILPAAGSALARPPGPPAVLVYAERLDGSFLDGLRRDLGIQAPAFAFRAEPGRAALALPGIGPAPPGYVVWSPERPGRTQSLLLLPALAAALLFCVFLALLVAARDRIDRAIRESEARFRDISEAASDWIWETDADWRLSYVSEASRRSLGIPPAQLIGRDLTGLLLPLDGAPAGSGGLAALAAAGPFHGVAFRCLAAAGEPRVLRVAGKAVLEESRLVGYRGIATDITAEVAALDQARFLARHDALTGLPNRMLLAERLAAMLARPRRRAMGAAVLCLDLDGFKEVNDTLGHAAGDLLLVRCAERLRACLRGGDSVARQGGDEFTVLQDEVAEPADAEGLCRRIVAVLGEPFDLDGRKAQVTVSIGVALVPADGDEPALLLQRADMALYRAKSGGRNRHCFFEPGMDRQLRLRRRAEADLRRALAEGEFRVCYQPQVACATGSLVGVEALVRWQHPERGVLLPGEFLPLAEEVGLIGALGAHVLHTACQDAVAWPGVAVAVNVATSQFRRRDFAATVAEALRATGLPGSRLELEVTEGLLVHDDGDALAILAEIKALGVRIIMDDFGTGYSSLAYLQRFPFDKIKIDRSFVRQLGGRPNTRAIVRAMVQLGRSLAVPICAEGVENATQLDLLRDEGCQEAQGFYFARPVPAAEVADLLRSWAAGGHEGRRDRSVARREAPVAGAASR
jgi:diguanylate cyclase (GGDEF)-like protein/PAS domain S-box-containing protein